jgi:hypothetical protein
MCIPLLLLDNGPAKKLTVATNTHTTIEELLEASSKRKVCNEFFPELLVNFAISYAKTCLN